MGVNLVKGVYSDFATGQVGHGPISLWMIVRGVDFITAQRAVADIAFLNGVQRGIIWDRERALLLHIAGQPLTACFRLAGLSYLPFRSPAVLFLPR